MIVSSEIAPIEVAQDYSPNFGRYLELRQGSQSLTLEVGALGALVRALCEASYADTITLEIGDRRFTVPGWLGLEPGEYGAIVVVEP